MTSKELYLWAGNCWEPGAGLESDARTREGTGRSGLCIWTSTKYQYVVI